MKKKKKCGICKDKKILAEFGRNKSKKDGLQTECRECGKVRSCKYKADRKARRIAERERGIKPKPTGRKPERFPYKGMFITMAQVMALPECKYSRPYISRKIKEGFSLDEILLRPPTKEELEAEQKLIRDERARQRVLDRAIIKQSKADIKRQRALKIMSIPVNIKKTQEYYMMKAYTYKADSEVEPIKLTKGGGY